MTKLKTYGDLELEGFHVDPSLANQNVSPAVQKVLAFRNEALTPRVRKALGLTDKPEVVVAKAPGGVYTKVRQRNATDETALSVMIQTGDHPTSETFYKHGNRSIHRTPVSTHKDGKRYRHTDKFGQPKQLSAEEMLDKLINKDLGNDPALSRARYMDEHYPEGRTWSKDETIGHKYYNTYGEIPHAKVDEQALNMGLSPAGRKVVYLKGDAWEPEVNDALGFPTEPELRVVGSGDGVRIKAVFRSEKTDAVMAILVRTSSPYHCDTYFRHGDYEFRQSSHDREPMRGVDEMIEDLYKSVNRDPHLKEARDAARVRVVEELASYKQDNLEQ